MWWMWVGVLVWMMVLSGSVLSCEEFFVNDFGRKVSASYLSMVAAIRERQEGATAAEYALLVALISVVIIGTVTLLGAQINAAFAKVQVAIEGANAA